MRSRESSADLRDRQLDAVELRDVARAEALILAWDGYWFFERVPSGAKLEAALSPDDAMPGLVYGATGARGTWDDASNRKWEKPQRE